MSLKVLGDRVLILPKDLTREHSIEGSNLKIALAYGDLENAHKMASQEGTIVDIGPEAWSEYKQPWCKVGDKVVFAQYAGKFVTDPESKINYIVINDIDVQVRVEG